MKMQQSIPATARGWITATLVALSFVACATVDPAPSRMQAIVQTGLGGPEVLKLQTLGVPDPGPDQVLIRVYAASVNPTDWKQRALPAGGAPATAAAAAPRIPGRDVAGVIAKTGAGVTTLKAGDAVFAQLGRDASSGLNGGYAEFALVPAANAVPKPRALTYAQASGIGVVGATGERVVEATQVSRGQRVLITGVAGGVGSSAAQIAHARGAYVIGTASARHNAYLKSIGVAEIIDYTQGDFASQVHDVDVVIDTIGGDTGERALATLKKGGIFVTVVGHVGSDKCAAAGVTCADGTATAPGARTDGEYLRAVAKLADAGQFSVNVDRTYPLARAAAAQEYNRDGHTEGKVILAVDAAQAGRK